MKKLLLIPIFLFILIAIPSMAFAQSMMNNWISSSSVTSNDHTAREEVEGKEIWEKLQAKQLKCKNLTDDDYQALGEYFMGQSIGNTQRHAAINQMMTSMIGEEGEGEMHIAMGKRLSSCEPNAQVPSSGAGFMPMMWMMGSTGSPQVGGGGNPMMGYGQNMMWGYGGLFISIFWVIILIDLILLGVWLWKQIQKN